MTTLILKRTAILFLAMVLAAAGLLLSLTASVPAQAQTMNGTSTTNNDDGVSDLGRLIILNSLFAGGSFGGSGSFGLGTSLGGTNLTNLILLDALFDDDDNNGDDFDLDLDLGGNGNNGTDLGDLILLDALFSGGTTIGTGGIVGGSNVVLYTVQRGDTLSGIAARFLGNASLFPVIASANGITNPNLIVPGQVLRIPTTSTTGTVNLGGSFLGGGLFGGSNNLGQLIILQSLFNDND